MSNMNFSGPEDDYLERLRQEGPDPQDYSNGNGINWDDFEKDYDEWADKTGFPN